MGKDAFFKATGPNASLPAPKLEIPQIPHEVKARFPAMAQWEREFRKAVEVWHGRLNEAMFQRKQG